MHRMLIKKGSSEEGPKDKGKLLASALEYRERREREETRCIFWGEWTGRAQ